MLQAMSRSTSKAFKPGQVLSADKAVYQVRFSRNWLISCVCVCGGGGGGCARAFKVMKMNWCSVVYLFTQ